MKIKEALHKIAIISIIGISVCTIAHKCYRLNNRLTIENNIDYLFIEKLKRLNFNKIHSGI